MKRHRRRLSFDNLEQISLLSTVGPGVEYHFARRPRIPAMVLALGRAAREFGAKHVTIEPVLAAPGSLVEYQITFQFRGKTYSTDFTVYNHQTKGPQPG